MEKRLGPTSSLKNNFLMQRLLSKKDQAIKVWDNVLNNSPSYSNGLSHRTEIPPTKDQVETHLLGTWMEITEDFSGQLAEITTGSETGEAAQAEFPRRACHRKEDRGTKGQGIKDWISWGALSGAAEIHTKVCESSQNKWSSFHLFRSNKRRKGIE